jgi:hypothetical protein
MTRIVWLARHRTLMFAAFVTLASLASPLERALAAPPSAPLPVDPGTESELFQANEEKEDVDVSFADVKIAVPAGRVLIVEHVSVRVGVPAGQVVVGVVACQGGAGFGVAFHHLVFHAQTPSVFIAAHAMRCFATGGTEGIKVSISRSSDTGLMAVDASVSGHLKR